MLKRGFFQFFCAILFMIPIFCIIMFGTVNNAYSAEGGPVTVGVLLDEDFDYLDGDYFIDPNPLKISGWESETTGGSYSYGYYDFFKVTDSSSSAAVTLKKRFVSQSSGKITLEYRFKMP